MGFIVVLWAGFKIFVRMISWIVIIVIIIRIICRVVFWDVSLGSVEERWCRCLRFMGLFAWPVIIVITIVCWVIVVVFGDRL